MRVSGCLPGATGQALPATAHLVQNRAQAFALVREAAITDGFFGIGRAAGGGSTPAAHTGFTAGADRDILRPCRISPTSPTHSRPTSLSSGIRGV
ncbi:MAG: hypothetical protein HIU90_08410 [Proteobacteria bacterium]|nr:hypothetical protein [Pseudomonadota bacterium]